MHLKIIYQLIKFKQIDGVEINKFAIENLLSNPKENPFTNLYNEDILDFQPKEKIQGLMKKIALIPVVAIGLLLLYAAQDFPEWGDPASPASSSTPTRPD